VTPRRRTASASERSPKPASVVGSVSIIPERALPLSDLLAVEALVAIGIAAGLLLDRPGWYGAAAGLAVALVFVVRVGGLSLPRRLVRRLGFWTDRRRRKAAAKTPLTEPFDSELPDGSQIGFHWDGKTLMSLVRIQENPEAMTVMEPAATVSGETVSVQMLADCLQQFDITLDSIDVMSQGARSHGHGQIAAIYDAVLGPLPAIAQRSVWVAVRLDPTLCPEAVHHRGGGWNGILRTATTATRRVANRLSDAGLRPQIMTASGIAHATNELSDGVDLRNLGENWTTCHEGRFQLRSFFTRPSMFTTAGLGTLWTVPSHSTTVCVSLRRDERNDLIRLRGLARFDSHGVTRADLPGLGRLRGRQYAALSCSLPLPAPRRSVGQWVFASRDALRDLALPASGCGQVVGANEDGRAVALPLFGPQIQRVEICGTLHLAQQVVLRSLALGARVRVHTRRAAAWRAMVEQVGDHNLLRVTERDRGSIQAGAERNYSVEMFDGETEQTVRVGVTAIVVNPPDASPSPHADVTLQLVDRDHDVVRVDTRTGSAVVTMVATDDEMRYIKSSFELVD
jgi:type VII secretion protein EccE